MNTINEKLDDLIELNSDMSEPDTPLTKPKRGRPKGVPKEPKPNGRKVRSEKQIEAWNKALAKTAEKRAIVKLAKEEKMAEIYINKKNRESKQTKQSKVEEVEYDDVQTSDSESSIELVMHKIKSKSKEKSKKAVVLPPPKQKTRKSRKVYMSSSSSSSASDSESYSESSEEVIRYKKPITKKKVQVLREPIPNPLSFFI
jgi:hypothetical protein